MDGFSTITQKGQVAIPKQIRDQLNIKPFDRVRFTLKDRKIIAELVSSVHDMFGVISVKKVVSKKAYKETVRKQILKKYAHSS